MPFIIFELLVAIFHANTSSADIVAILGSIRNLEQNFMVLVGMVPFFMHVLTYVILAKRTLVHHREELKQYYSSIDLDWAFQVIQMVVIIFLISFLSSIVQYSGLKTIFFILLLSLIVISVVLTSLLLLKAMSHPLFQAVTRSVSGNELSIREMEEVKEKIIRIFSEKKLFTNPELTLKDLAGEINVSDRTASQVINKLMGKNFYDFVNDYRIREACQIFDTHMDPRLTVLEVLYQVGFNSKSSFNTQFKKKTGLTPSEYKASQRK
jgi:AraC-like DNA-binding protein